MIATHMRATSSGCSAWASSASVGGVGLFVMNGVFVKPGKMTVTLTPVSYTHLTLPTKVIV